RTGRGNRLRGRDADRDSRFRATQTRHAGALRHRGGITPPASARDCRRISARATKSGSGQPLEKTPRRCPNAARFVGGERGYASALFTRSGDIGRLRIRLPVSWNSALAIAGATATTPISPMPVGGFSVVTILVWMSGTLLMRST